MTDVPQMGQAGRLSYVSMVRKPDAFWCGAAEIGNRAHDRAMVWLQCARMLDLIVAQNCRQSGATCLRHFFPCAEAGCFHSAHRTHRPSPDESGVAR